MNSPPPPINLLYLITDLKYGGAQSVLLNLLEHLDRERFAPRVACLFGGELPVGMALRARGIPVTDLKMSHPWRVDALWRLYRLLKREQIALLHASLFHASLVGRIIGRLAGTPVVLSWRHGVSLDGRWRDVANRLTSGLDDGVVAVSEPARQAELKSTGVPQHKVEYICNGIDVERFAHRDSAIRQRLREELGIPSESFLIGFVGRLHPQKGVGDLLDAFGRISAGRSDVRLLIVGEGESGDALKSLAHSLGISARTHFAGSRKDIPAVLAALDLFVLPSLAEGLPLALLEAMAARLPVIATAVGGVPDVVIQGETGLLTPARDAPALAAAISKLVHHPVLRQQMASAGQRRVRERHSAAEMTHKMEALYTRLLAEKGLFRP